MNIEEIDILLNKKYGVSFTSLCGTHNLLFEKSKKLEQENEKLHSIIKEVREKIEDEIERATNSIYIELDEDTYIKMFKELLEILDKENK